MKRNSTCAMLICAAVLTGCSGKHSGPQTAEVTGVVLLNDAPVSGANVQFHPRAIGAAAKPSQATTDDQGRFAMNTYIGPNDYKPGIVPGEYVVTVTKLDTSNVTSTLTRPKNVLPAKYASAQTTDLSATVSLDKDIEIDLRLVP